MKIAIAFIASSFALASSAYAADINTPAAPVPYVYSYLWTGLYVGADVGGAWARSSGRWDPMNNLGKPDPGYFGEFPISGGMSGSGILAGGHVGYNYQFAPSWVVGVEADWSWTEALWSAAAGAAGTGIGQKGRMGWDFSRGGKTPPQAPIAPVPPVPRAPMAPIPQAPMAPKPNPMAPMMNIPQPAPSAPRRPGTPPRARACNTGRDAWATSTQSLLVVALLRIG